MRIGFDHFGEVVGGTGEWEFVFDGEAVGGLGTVKSLFVTICKKQGLESVFVCV